MADQVKRIAWENVALYSQLVKIGETPEKPDEATINEMAAWPLSSKVERIYEDLGSRLLDIAWADEPDIRRSHTKEALFADAAFLLWCTADAAKQLSQDEIPEIPRDPQEILKKAAAQIETDECDDYPPVHLSQEDLTKIITLMNGPEVKELIAELWDEDGDHSKVHEIGGLLAMVIEPDTKSYTLTVTIDANTLKTILNLTGGGHGDLSPEEAARFTDTLVLKCSNPDKFNMAFNNPATEDTVPVSTLAGFNFNISTKFALAPEGVTFQIGEQSMLLKPGTPHEWDTWYTPKKTLEDLVRGLKSGLLADDSMPEPTPMQPLPQGGKLPEDSSQYTFEEMRAVSYAMADTSTLRYWTPAERDSDLNILSMLYKRPGERFEIKFDPDGLSNELRTGLQLDTTDAIEEFLRRRGFRGTLTLQMMGKAAILKTDEAITLDDFVNKLFDPRTAKERHEARRWVWDTIRTILALRLYGGRTGIYTDPETKKPIDLTFRGEPFIVLSPGARKFARGQESLWPDSDIPVTIGFTMGAWGKEMKKHHAILSQFGKLDQVLAISAGKPAGAWAQCILFNLNQLWREKAKDVSVTTHTRTDRNGDEHTVIATRWPNTFTRRQLLCHLCPPDQAFSVMDILSSDRPGRAKNYWNAAIKLLQDQGSVTYYKELSPLDPKRKGWAEDWLDQPLDIRPNEDGKKAAREIKASQQKVVKSRKRKPKSNSGNP